MPVPALTIGQVAAEAGVTRKAIRVWIDRGLLAARDHTPTGYQLFAPDTVELAVFIRRARALGISLAQIQIIMRASPDGASAPCPEVRQLLRNRMADIDATVADLLALRATLEAACTERPDPGTGAAVCPIIERSAP